MSGIPRHAILRDGIEVGAVYDLPWHGQVALHADDPALTTFLVKEGLVTPARPPFLDAADSGIHGAYRPRTQVNLFFQPPLESVVEALRPALERAGYGIAAAESAR